MRAQEMARERGETNTREQVAAEIIKHRPGWADMIADAEGPCPLCGATGHALEEEAPSLPPEQVAEAIEVWSHGESQA